MAVTALAPEHRLHRNVRIRLVVTFFLRLLSVMTLPLLAIYFAAELGPVRAGLLLAVSVAAATICAILGGHLADVLGRRGTLLITEPGIVLTFAGMALADSSVLRSPVLVYVFFLVNGCLASMGLAAGDAIVMDTVTQENRARIYTRRYWSTNLAVSLGATAGALLYQHHFDLVLWGGTALTGGIFLATLLFVEETSPARRALDAGRQRAREWLGELTRGYRFALGDRIFTQYLIACIMITTVESQLAYYIGVHLALTFGTQTLLSAGSLHVQVTGVRMAGIVRTEGALLVFAALFVTRRLFRSMPDRLQMNLGIAIFTLGFMALAVARNGWLLLAISVVYTIGELMNVPIRQVLMVDIIDPRMRAKYIALYSLRPRAAAILASLGIVAGSVIGPWGMAALYAVCGATAITLLRRPWDAAPERAERFAQPLSESPSSNKTKPGRATAEAT
jgi:DHA1 family multidrug resistance protein B-like MFS transporter